MKSERLQRVIGGPTALLIGMGVAIGSGIFRTPGAVAGPLHAPWLIILVWMLGGLVAMMQGLVTAELATRFPKAGGDYVFLREAYGRFPAFFFGWAFTLFGVGGGAALIAISFGDFSVELFTLEPSWSGPLAAVAIVAVTAINAAGLRTGAGTQNVLTCLKIAALLAIVVIGFAWDRPATVTTSAPTGPPEPITLAVFLTAAMPVLWSYFGATDPAMMAEEIKDVRRALPRALIGSVVALTALYVAVNLALLCVVPAGEMVGVASVPGEAMRRLFGPTGGRAMLLIGMLVCLGTLSSTVLATIRVTFALARDGLAFTVLSRMSASQAPVPALVLIAAFAITLVLTRGFEKVLGIYFFATAILFGLSYASLIVFRLRERTFPKTVFRCPFGVVLASALILLEVALAANIANNQPRDAWYTVIVLAAVAALYLVWKRQSTEIASSE